MGWQEWDDCNIWTGEGQSRAESREQRERGIHLIERVKKAIIRIAATPDRRLSDEVAWRQRWALVPALSLASALYALALSLLSLRRACDVSRLPVPVISVGNITWGGNGKTPCVEFLSRFFLQSRITPLILTRGYAGGDEAKMLQRHLSATSAKFGVGKNRAQLAASLINKFGHTNSLSFLHAQQSQHLSQSHKIGVVILDDGMQHWSLARQVELIMINALMPWGNGHLIPCGPLREPLDALQRAHIIVIHHANLVSEVELKTIESTILRICSKTIPLFFSELIPSHFFEIKTPNEKLPLSTVHGLVVLCVSAIGCPDSFVKALIEIGALHIHRLDFSDHHAVQSEDIKLIKDKIRSLALVHDNKAAIVMTEKVPCLKGHLKQTLNNDKVEKSGSSIGCLTKPNQVHVGLFLCGIIRISFRVATNFGPNLKHYVSSKKVNGGN